MPQYPGLTRSPRVGSSAATKKHIPWVPKWLITGGPSPLSTSLETGTVGSPANANVSDPLLEERHRAGPEKVGGPLQTEINKPTVAKATAAPPQTPPQTPPPQPSSKPPAAETPVGTIVSPKAPSAPF